MGIMNVEIVGYGHGQKHRERFFNLTMELQPLEVIVAILP
jgi:hypothetical protein